MLYVMCTWKKENVENLYLGMSLEKTDKTYTEIVVEQYFGSKA